MTKEIIVFIALGSNLGDRSANLARARQLISAFISDFQTSSLYETAPWGVLDQPKFLNQVVKGKTTLAPLKLLGRLKAVEKTLGREKTIRYGPRIIDLDILLYGDRVIEYRRLQVPHPRMYERAFVLVPLAEIAAAMVIPPAGASVAELLSRLNTSGVTQYLEPEPDARK